ARRDPRFPVRLLLHSRTQSFCVAIQRVSGPCWRGDEKPVALSGQDGAATLHPPQGALLLQRPLCQPRAPNPVTIQHKIGLLLLSLLAFHFSPFAVSQWTVRHMLAKVYSVAVSGLDAYSVEVEVDLAAGLPMFTVVGLPDLTVRESRARDGSALRNGGVRL